MLHGFATRQLCVCALILAVAPALTAQTPEKMGSLEGEVRPSDNTLGMVVEVFDLRTRMVVGRDSTTASGQFNFSNLPVGEYEVRLTNLRGDIVAQAYARVTGGVDHVSLVMSSGDKQAPPSGTVSVQKLARAPIPKQARKEFEQGVKESQKNNSDAAIEHFRKALEIAPDYMEAHTNLGARLLRNGKVQEAVPHLEKAAELDPGSWMAFGNLAIAYIKLNRLDDAQRAAEQAERLDPASAKARYILGLVLVQNGHKEEGLRYLKAVADEVPYARLAIAQTMADSGDLQGAAGEVRQYLASSSPAHRDEAQQWLQRLEAKTGGAAAAGGMGQ